MSTISPTPISSRAERAREDARAADGRFGVQSHSEPDVQLHIEHTRDQLRCKYLLLQEETVREIRAVASRVPGADTALFRIRDGEVVFDSIEDRAHVVQPIDPLAHARLTELAAQLDFADLRHMAAGSDGDWYWVPVHRPAQQAELAYEQVMAAKIRLARSEPGSLEAATAAREVETASVEAVRHAMPAGIREVHLGYRGDGTLELLGGLTESGVPVPADFWDETTCSAWASVAGYVDGIRNADLTDDSDEGVPPFIIRRPAA